MKNLLIYLNPIKNFDPEHQILAKIQIDNSLDLGWKPEDILLVTNFSYEYNGIKAIELKDEVFCSIYKYASKITAIINLFELGLIENEFYWFHDFDAFQNHEITEAELELDEIDLGLTDYGRIDRWNAGSFFFKNNTQDIFELIRDEIYTRADKAQNQQQLEDYYYISEETVLMHLTHNNVNNINNRIKRLNITYNYGMRRILTTWAKAIKPLKVLHFHPFSKVLDTLGIAMYGKNRLKAPLMSNRLIGIFNRNGIK